MPRLRRHAPDPPFSGTADRRRALARAGLLGALIALVAVLVFAIQNTAQTDVHFLWLTWYGGPVFAVILVSFLGGIVIGTASLALRTRLRAGSGSELPSADLAGRPFMPAPTDAALVSQVPADAPPASQWTRSPEGQPRRREFP